MDGLAGELDENACLTFGKLNSQVNMHTSALEDVRTTFFLYIVSSLITHLKRISCLVQCLKGLLLEADRIVNELQSRLSNQEDQFDSFIQLQREVDKIVAIFSIFFSKTSLPEF